MTNPAHLDPSSSPLRDGAPLAPLIEIIRERGYQRRDEPFRLTSGQWSHDYVDGKRATADGANLKLAAEAVVSVARAAGVEFDAVGGLTMGADPLAHAIAVVTGTAWFSVRKEAKAHGKEKLIEGAELGPSSSILVVDDVVTTGGSILRAVDAVEAAGARVALAVALVDRGPSTAEAMRARGIAYRPVVTYEDLGIDPVVSR